MGVDFTWTDLLVPALLLALTGCQGYLEVYGLCLEPERADGESQKVARGALVEGDPAVVGILRKGGEIFCSGTLVAERVVLTAAHCVQGKTPTGLEVVFGESGDGLRVGVLASVVHPDYVPEPVYDNDLAMLLLQQSVPVEVAPPVPMATCIAGALDDAELRLVGFGKVAPDDESPPLKRQGWGSVDWTGATSFTTGTAPAQACVGDSGGPAFIRFSGREYLAGVVSHGDHGCERYAAYTRVDAFYDTFIVYYLDPETPSPTAPPSPHGDSPSP